MKDVSPWRNRRSPQSEIIEPEYRYTSTESEVHLSEYWKILVKRRRTIIVIAFVTFALGAYFPLTASKLYTASATVKIEPQIPQVSGVGALQPFEGMGPALYDYHQTQFALLQGRSLAARVISDLGLASNKVFTTSQITSPSPLERIKSSIFGVLGPILSYVASIFRSDVENGQPQPNNLTVASSTGEAELNVPPDLIDRYLSFVKISPIPNTRLVEVRLITPDPSLSQALANAHAQSFMRMNFENRFTLTKEAREFLDQKKAELSQKMEVSEAALNRFRRAHGVVSVEKGENIVVDRLVDLNKQLTGARAQRIEAESLYRTVENKNYQDLADVMKQGLVQQLKSNVANLEAEKARSATVFKPDHPRIQDLVQQIAAARQALNTEIADIVRGIRSTYTAALAKERALEAETKKQEQDALKLKEVGVDYTLLQEEVNANRSLYENVLKRLSETNVSNDIAVSNIQVVERATKPLGPSSPNVPTYLLASIVSGLFFGVATAFIREYFDSTIGTPDVVWRSVGLSTLGVVPDLKLVTGGASNGAGHSGRSGYLQPSHTELIKSDRPLSIIDESYRTIRTALLLAQAEKPPQVILLTSPSPGEGKTVTSLNLGLALAQDGYSVLVVDADLRRGCCHTRLGLRNNNGLTNVLTGHSEVEDGIQKTTVEGLFLLSRGTLPPNPNELLGSGKMKAVLRDLREGFQFILIDSPPVVTLSDATVLSVLSDGVLLVFHGQKTQVLHAQKAVERLDMVHAPLVGVVLNAVDLDNPHYSYYRDYTSYYGSPHNGDGISEVNGNGFRKAVHSFDKISKIAEIWRSKKSQQAKDSTEAAVGNESIEEHRQNEWGSAAGVAKDSPDPFVTGLTDPMKQHSSEEGDSVLLPQAFLNQLTDVLGKAIGPIASVLVRDRIAVLEESEFAFPKSRVPELLNLIQREIDELRLGVRLSISKYTGNVEINTVSAADQKRTKRARKSHS